MYMPFSVYMYDDEIFCQRQVSHDLVVWCSGGGSTEMVSCCLPQVPCWGSAICLRITSQNPVVLHGVILTLIHWLGPPLFIYVYITMLTFNPP